MESPKAIKESLNFIQGTAIKRSFYRFIGIEYLKDLLGTIGALKGGRYNLKNAFEVLYMAPDPETAIAETTKSHNFRFPPKMIVTIDINVQHILDIEDKQTINLLGIDPEKLFCAWRIPSNKESYTQILGYLIYESKKFEGIRYPSAVVKDKYNIAIFPDRLKKGSEVKVYDPDKLIEQVILGK